MPADITTGRGGLTAAQARALAHVTARARSAAPLLSSPQVGGLAPSALEELRTRIAGRARVCVHFHPHRLAADGGTVIDGLLRTGVYRNQFETGISNGSATAFPGGERDGWERALFGGAYHEEGTPPSARPCYGALELIRYADGPAPRFGACHLRLRVDVTRRCSFTWGDSHLGPAHVGTLDALDDVLRALLLQVETSGAALGQRGQTPGGITSLILSSLTCSEVQAGSLPLGRVMDEYVEAQIHGALVLERDVEGIVADPAYQGGAVGEGLSRLAQRCGVPLEWHPGFVLRVEEVPADVRGPAMIPLASRVGGQGWVDIQRVGEAELDLLRRPERWADLGDVAQVRQLLKQLWHVLALRGAPRAGVGFSGGGAGGSDPGR